MAIKVTRTSRYLLIALVALLYSPPSPAQTTIYGGRGLMRVFSAEPIGRSQVFFNTYFQTFLDPSKRGNTLGKDHTLSLGFTLGLTNSFELTLQAVPYQDDQQHVWGPPGDTQIGLKMALPIAGLGLSTAMRCFAIIPTAKNANVAYEPYSSGELAFGLQGIATLDMTQSFPLVPLKAFFNFGYLDHSLKDAFFAASEDQILIGAGIKFPIRSLVFHSEYTGEIFSNNSGLSFAENSTRFSQGVQFLGPWNLAIDIAGDIGLDQPGALSSPPQYFQKDYADWKITVGVNYQFTARQPEGAPQMSGKPREDKRARRVLDEIRGKREAAQENLQEMEKALDDRKSEEQTEDEAEDESEEEKPPR